MGSRANSLNDLVTLLRTGPVMVATAGFNDPLGHPWIVMNDQVAAINGLSVQNAATGSSVLLSVDGVNADANAGLTIQARGSGTLTLGSDTGATVIKGSSFAFDAPLTVLSATTPQLTVAYDATHKYTVSVSSAGNVTLTPTGSLNITSASATALAVGLNGSTNPAFQVDASQGSMVNGLQVKGVATGFATQLNAIGSDSTINLSVNAKSDTGAVLLRANGREIADFTGVASAVNFFNFTNAATGVDATLAVVGDTNANFKLDAKNAGIVKIGTVSTGGVQIGNTPAFAAGDKYVVMDASGNLHVSSLGPVS